MLRKKLQYRIISSHSDDNGRLILLNLEISKKQFTIVNVYAPNDVNERIIFFRRVHSFIDTYAINEGNLIVGGDFNCVLSGDDRMSGKMDKSTEALKNVLVKLNVVDIWRYLHPDSKDFTYCDPSSSMRNSRIDLLLCSDKIKAKCLKSTISQAPTPDHKVVNVTIQLSNNVRGKGYWKLNNSFLDHKDYQDEIIKIYQEVVDEYSLFVSKSVLWDYFKLRVKQFSITYGIMQAKIYYDECKNLEVKLNDLDHKIVHSKCLELIQERKQMKDQLDELYAKKSKGYQIRARAKYVEQGEKSTQYFLGLEKKRQNSNCIDCLKERNGNYVYTDNDILDRAKQFYSELYTAKD